MEAVNNLKYIVYCTTNKINNKIYIGVHKTYSKEFDGYIGCGVYINKPNTYQQSKTVFQRAVCKYGPAQFQRVTIAEFDLEEDAMALEAELVNMEFLQRNDVYNMILGGYGNKNMRPSFKCYCYDLSGKFIQEFASIREAGRLFSGSEFSFNSIKNAIIDRVSYLGKYWALNKMEILDIENYTKDRRKKVKVFQYKATGEFEKEYESIAQAAKELNSCSSSIEKACLLGYLSKNKYFSYEKNEQFSRAKLEYLKTIPVYCYDITGKFLKEYSCTQDAEKNLKIKGSIMKALRLKCPHNNKYQFSFEKLEKMPDRSKSYKNTTAKKIDQYDLDGNYIKTWNSITECRKALGVQSNCINRILKGIQHKTKNFTFKVHKD